MNGSSLCAQTALRLEVGPDTRLHGRALVMARAACLIGGVLGLTSFIARLPSHFADLQQVCTTQTCGYGQLDADAASTFHTLDISLSAYAVLRIGITLMAALTWFTVAAIIAWRRSDDWFASLVTLWLVSEGTATVTGALTLGYYSTWQSLQLSAQVVNFCARFGFFLAFSLFPTGRFVPRWSFLLVLAFAVEEMLYEFRLLYHPVGPSPALPSLIWLATLVGLALAQIYRYRRVSSPVERQQTKWALVGITLFIVLAGVLLAPVVIWPHLGATGTLYNNAIHTLGLIVVGIMTPVAIGLAILRYHLWDVDVLINKALVYGLLTAVLGALYFGMVLGAQAIVQGLTGQSRGNPAIIAGSTLLIYFLFRPLRRRIQAGIDRRFYRRKYDAATTLEAFGATLRTETDLEHLRAHVLGIVCETMQPGVVSLWLRGSQRGEEAHV
jgi:hypothetical protein